MNEFWLTFMPFFVFFAILYALITRSRLVRAAKCLNGMCRIHEDLLILIERLEDENKDLRKNIMEKK